MDVKIALLLVEDDEVDQLAFKRAVQATNLPYDFEIAGTLAQAKSLLGTRQFDVILSDYNLSDGSAFDVLEFSAQTPVIVVTGAGDEDIAVRAMKAGAYDYLIKDPRRNYLKILPTIVEQTLRRRAVEVAEREQRTLAEALGDTATALTSTLKLDEVLERILTNVKLVVPYETATVMLIEGETARVVQCAGWERELTVQALMQRHFPVVISSDLREMYNTHKPHIVSVLNQDLPHFPGVNKPRSYLGAPLCVGQDVIGFLNLGSSTEGFYGNAHADRLQAFADQAAIALQNARLYHQAKDLAAMEERQRLARDLHDSVTQMLFAASLLSETLVRLWQNSPDDLPDRLLDVHRLTQGALAEMRNLLLELRPQSLAETDIENLLKQLTTSVAGRSTIEVQLFVQPMISLPSDVKIVFYRIAQEALNNIVKHSRAQHVQIGLYHENEQIVMRIDDDGRGFVTGTIPSNRLGVNIMKERAESIHASFNVTSRLGHGTQIIVSWSSTSAIVVA